MELTVQNVYGLLIRSQLLTLDEAKGMFAHWQSEAGGNASNAARFAAWMVTNRYVTEYQATLLARGHADGFFVNEYKILDRLGKGRMAGVYKAQHRLGPIVALKVLPPSKGRDPSLLRRFQREAKLAVRLKHPNIVRTFQLGRAGPLHYLVMEFLEGETLEELLLRDRSLPAPEAVRLIYQALEGLEHIHERKLVHRDLKPANLMLVPAPGGSTQNCTLKILDIGLGKLFRANREDSGLTTEGVVLGTPDYMAPEQARDPRGADIRADIYSLGCVLYQLLTGQPPFPDTNIISQMIKHASEPPKPLKELNKDVPDGLQQILNWMLAKDPANRYQTPGRAAQALEMFLAADAGPLSSPDLDPAMTPYLDWLETQRGRHAAPPATVPVARPVNSPPVVPATEDRTALKAPARVATSRPSEEHRRRVKKKRPLPPVPAGGEPSAVDVELVSLPAGARAAGSLTRRDFFMFGAGVSCVLIAYAIGRGLAALFSRWRDSRPNEVE